MRVADNQRAQIRPLFLELIDLNMPSWDMSNVLIPTDEPDFRRVKSALGDRVPDGSGIVFSGYPYYGPAVLGQSMDGEYHTSRCGPCSEGKGPFRSCKTIERNPDDDGWSEPAFDGACMNCLYQGLGKSCSKIGFYAKRKFCPSPRRCPWLHIQASCTPYLALSSN